MRYLRHDEARGGGGIGDAEAPVRKGRGEASQGRVVDFEIAAAIMSDGYQRATHQHLRRQTGFPPAIGVGEVLFFVLALDSNRRAARIVGLQFKP